MEIICPKCKFSRDVPEEKIPPKARQATCPKCGHKFIFRELPEQRQGFPLEQGTTEKDMPQAPKVNEEQKDAEDNLCSKNEEQDSLEAVFEENYTDSKQNVYQKQKQTAIPWERLEEYGFFPGFFLTLKAILFSPSRFFERMPFQGYVKPLVFYLLIAEIQAVGAFLTDLLAKLAGQQGLGEPSLAMFGLHSGISSLAILILYPILLTGLLFAGAFVNHLFLLVCGAGKRGFEGTFRAVAYGSAPMIISILPVLGQMIGLIWAFIVSFIAYKYIHRTSYWRVFLALGVLPLLLSFVLVGFGLGKFGVGN
ncbi:MAG: YIP1 family protein [Desulfonauticus sp.]|nr:YIP1 family protein [Desulfonauticus sp.]